MALAETAFDIQNKHQSLNKSLEINGVLAIKHVVGFQWNLILIHI